MNAILLSGLFLVQNPPPIDEVRVEDAIKRGVQYLRGQERKTWTQENRTMSTDELLLWTLVHAGVPETDPLFQKLLTPMLEEGLTVTYRVALQAMILEEIDRIYYQGRIAQCAQFLIDNQSPEGCWGYGDPTTLPDNVPTGKPRWKDQATGFKIDLSGRRDKPKVRRFLPIRQQRVAPSGGDNSNCQYAALGLRACHEAGVVLPRDVLQKAKRWWEQAQNQDGGWCYRGRGDRPSWGTMSAGGLGSLVILKFILGEKWQSDRRAVAGIKWLTDNYTVQANPGKIPTESDPMWHYYYFMYALERAAILYGTEKLGDHWWYQEGAQVLLERQNKDGSWVSSAPNIGDQHHIYDTCFAILFLRRATRPLQDVATGEGQKKRSNR
ncbi:MAG: terpene cyclase/mutase family protein [Planctomycetes bacterium]|nr:terpene cyclase/mutase family protein [Planctomycetota bacterium]